MAQLCYTLDMDQQSGSPYQFETPASVRVKSLLIQRRGFFFNFTRLLEGAMACPKCDGQVMWLFNASKTLSRLMCIVCAYEFWGEAQRLISGKA